MSSVPGTWPPAEVVYLSSDDDDEPSANTTAAGAVNLVQRLEIRNDDTNVGEMPVFEQGVADSLDDLFAFDEAGEDEDVGVAPPTALGAGIDRNTPPDLDIGQYLRFGNDVVFIPDENREATSAAEARMGCVPAYNKRPAAQPVTADTCLARVLELFPDISHEYVHTLYNEFDRDDGFEALEGRDRLENIMEQLISSENYPKQERGRRSSKRKRGDSSEPDTVDATRRWSAGTRATLPLNLDRTMQAILKADFPDIVSTFIANTLKEHRYLFPTYVALAKAQDDSANGNRLYGKGRPSSRRLDASMIAQNSGFPALDDELRDARAHVFNGRNARREEQENLDKAKENGTLAACSACFDDLPMNRQIYCSGVPAHFTCFDCALTYVKTKVGESQCNLPCPAGCGEGFTSRQLDLLSDKKLLEKLAQLQQEKDIRDAQLEDLEDCPFCDFKAIVPPIEEDFEFRCANPECEVVSCRRCRRRSHVPITCEQYASEDKLDSRHKLEEAMTAALVRACNSCKKQFIKESGCNKMTCPSCGNRQCYVCSQSINDYNHFNQANTGHMNRAAAIQETGNGGKCPLYDDVNARHEHEVRKAEKETRDRLVQENPDLAEGDLEIKTVKGTMNHNRNARPNGYLAGAVQGFPDMLDGVGDIWAHPALERHRRHVIPARAMRPAQRRHNVPVVAQPAMRGVQLDPGVVNHPRLPIGHWQHLDAAGHHPPRLHHPAANPVAGEQWADPAAPQPLPFQAMPQEFLQPHLELPQLNAFNGQLHLPQDQARAAQAQLRQQMALYQRQRQEVARHQRQQMEQEVRQRRQQFLQQRFARGHPQNQQPIHGQVQHFPLPDRPRVDQNGVDGDGVLAGLALTGLIPNPTAPTLPAEGEVPRMGTAVAQADVQQREQAIASERGGQMSAPTTSQQLQEIPRPYLERMPLGMPQRTLPTVGDLRAGLDEIRNGFRQLRLHRGRPDQQRPLIDHLIQLLEQQQTRIEEVSQLVDVQARRLAERRRQDAEGRVSMANLPGYDVREDQLNNQQLEIAVNRNQTHLRQLAAIRADQDRRIEGLRQRRRQLDGDGRGLREVDLDVNARTDDNYVV